MTSPLDEKGLGPNQFEFKGAVYEVGPMERHRYFGNRRPITTIKKADTALSALAASQPIGDGMEVVAYAEILGGRITAVRIDKSRHCVHGMVLADQAAALIAAKDARIEELTRERDEADNALVDKYRDPKTGSFKFPSDVAAIVRRLETAEAQAHRLTEDNQALRGVVSESAASLMNGAAISTDASLDFMKLLPTEIRAVVRGDKARIKALEEAIDKIADFDPDGPLSPEAVKLIRIAGGARRATLDSREKGE